MSKPPKINLLPFAIGSLVACASEPVTPDPGSDGSSELGAPTNLVITDATATAIVLAWTASPDVVDGYSVYRGGAKLGDVAATDYSDAALECGTSYAYAVEAFDADGNRSRQATVSGSTRDCTIGDGFPDATNTGPAPGTVFQDFSGVYEVQDDNVVLNGLRVTGSIIVHGDNVTIQNCEVDATGQIWGILADGAGVIVTHCHVYGVPSPTNYEGTHVLTGVDGVAELAYSNIHGVENAVGGGTNHIHDNYLHDFANWFVHDNHTDGVQTYGSAGAGGLRVVHNTIIAIETGGDFTPTNYQGASSAVALSEDMHDLTIANNYLAGGSYTLYGPSQAGASPANVHVTSNRFSTAYYPNCGAFGTHTGFAGNAPGFQWSGNVWHESGLPVAF
jgi:hypothetical protein